MDTYPTGRDPAHPPSSPTPLDAGAAGHSALGAAALAGVAAFALAGIAVHLLRPGLDPVAAQMSVYLVGPWGPVLQAGYAALAVGILALAFALYRVPRAPARSAAPLVLFAIAAPSLVVTALAPMRFPGEELRLIHLVHGTSAQAAFLCTTAAMVLQAWRLRAAPAWRQVAPVLLGWALACFAGVWVLALVRELPRGLSQKVLVAMIVGWLGTVALRYWRGTRTGRR
jgi:hypothetical protein